MAEAGRTVRVSGLPTDVEDEKLRDKLLIHFLRKKNEGGEIDSIVIDRAVPGSALIRFEDSAVARKIVQCSHHTLDVDQKTYVVTTTQHHEAVDPDQIVLSIRATIDYRFLPGGVIALIALSESHRDIQMNYTETDGCCTLEGSYSRIQAALAHLLGPPAGSRKAQEKRYGCYDAPSVLTPQASQAQASEEAIGKHRRHRERRPNGGTAQERGSVSTRDAPPGEHGGSQPRPSVSSEDLTLIMDADLFQYLQKHCAKEYRDVLSANNIEAVDVTSGGVTTLFFQPLSVPMEERQEEDRGQERVRRAKKAITRLYQENESRICRTQLSKGLLSPAAGLQKAMTHLSGRFPRLLLNQDEQNIYIIGSSGDVYEAKNYLVNLKEAGGSSEDAPGSFQRPSYEYHPTLASPDAVRSPSPERSLDSRIEQMMRSTEDDKRGDPSKKYKLAARFRDEGLPILGNRPQDFTTRTPPLASKHSQLKPPAGYDAPPEPALISGKEVPRAMAQQTGGDILFRNDYSGTSSTLDKYSGFTESRSANSSSQFSPTLSSLSGSPASSGSRYGTSLKRASSFSGTTQRKADVGGQKSFDDSSDFAAGVRGRSASFSSQPAKPGQDVHVAEVSEMSQVMWMHIKEAYGTRVDDLTSDLQVREQISRDGRHVALCLRGADPSTVRACQQRLQQLVDAVALDFVVQQLSLSELGVADIADETLQACLSEVTSRFKKVTVHLMEKSFYLLGPKELCAQVCATLMEVFHGNQEEHRRHPSSSLGAYADETITPQTIVDSQAFQSSRSGGSYDWKTTYNSDFGQKEITNGSEMQTLGRMERQSPPFLDVYGHMTRSDLNFSPTGGSMSPVNGAVSRAFENDRASLLKASDGYGSGLGNSMGFCACGDVQASMTKCGVSMCQSCLEKLHSKCSVCLDPEQEPQGIQGRMKTSKLNMSLPGHNKYGVIKITYVIPDGIQQTNHPSPGKPFRGGSFEAYLPDCERAKKLLPRLQKAFKRGLTFTVTGREGDAKVTWDCIPHKTSLHEGKAKNGYPDSSYLTRLSDILSGHGID